jgi:hypothetical protein
MMMKKKNERTRQRFLNEGEEANIEYSFPGPLFDFLSPLF